MFELSSNESKDEPFEVKKIEEIKDMEKREKLRAEGESCNDVWDRN